MRTLLLVALCALLLVTFAKCDLPVHCEYTQMHGEWSFKLTKNGQPRDIGYNVCAFDKPLTEPIEKVMQVRLEAPNVATNVESGATGTWTLIYDQGFEIRLESNRYFAFFNFTKDAAGKIISHCGETFTGWYHDNVVQSTNWGCFKGVKVQKVEPFVYEQPKKIVNLDKVFKNDDEFINAINAAQSSWTAAAYPELDGTPLYKLVRQVAKRSNTMKREAHKRHMQFMKQFQPSVSALSFVANAPTEFDWRNATTCGAAGCVSAVRNQGSCGSCYTYGSTGMFADRVRIQTQGKSAPVFSTQDILNCDFYSQKCDGGFSFSVSKYGNDHGITTEECDPYTARPAQCTNKCGPSTRTFIKDYHYLGGYYGACNEQVMIEALLSNGPYAVDFEVYRDFFNYKSGVYSHVKSVTSKFSEPDPHWEQANHVVSIIGLGVTPKNEKYWIVRNSWGSGWGNQGYFWIKRGVDECAIESAAVEAFPITN